MERFHAYGKEIGVHVSSFSIASVYFEDRPDWAAIDENGNAGGIFTRSWVVTNPLGGGASRQIQVTVSWTKGGPNRSVVLTSITRGNGT